MSKLPGAIATLALLGLAVSSTQAQSLVIDRFGDGSAALSSAATADFLDQYSLTGTQLGTIALPTTVAASSTSEGFLTLSGNGTYLTAVGYAAPAGTTAVAGTASSATNRVIDRINISGPTTSASSIDSSTLLQDAYSGSNIRSAVTTNGTTFYTAGTGSSGTTAGIRQATFGTNVTTTQLESSPTNTRVVNLDPFDTANIYFSSASGTFQGISSVPVGGGTATELPGFPTASGPSSYDFLFASATTLYVADDRATASGGGLQKWTLVGSTWTLQYTLSTGLSAGLRGLAGVTVGGNETFFATSADSATKLVTITDAISNTTAPATSFTTLATAGTNEAFRGVEYLPNTTVFTGAAAPEPSGVVSMLLGVGVLGLIAIRRRCTTNAA
jgi:hypothetical protein